MLRDEIIKYYQEHEVVYPSDLAQAFDLDLREAVAISQALLAEGVIQVIEEFSLIRHNKDHETLS